MTAAPTDPGSALRSAICHLDAAGGRLSYRGYDVRELAEQASFEEVAYLLVHGELPAPDAHRRFLADVRTALVPAKETRKILALVPTGVDEMAVLRTGLSATGMVLPRAAAEDEGARLVGQVAGLVASRFRLARERPIVKPKRGLGLAANFLLMLHGEEPDVQVARAFESALILRADNELNPSAFAARVAASTGADLTGCLTAAVAALAGPKHGAHSIKALEMLLEIAEPSRADAWIAARTASGKGFAGFGHPVYSSGDPRTVTARGLAELACERMGTPEYFELARVVEKKVQLASGAPANIDYWLATLYRAMDIPVELFTPVFAVARACGWIAHAREQRQDPALLRPRATYVGPAARAYLPARRGR